MRGRLAGDTGRRPAGSIADNGGMVPRPTEGRNVIARSKDGQNCARSYHRRFSQQTDRHARVGQSIPPAPPAGQDDQGHLARHNDGTARLVIDRAEREHQLERLEPESLSQVNRGHAPSVRTYESLVDEPHLIEPASPTRSSLNDRIVAQIKTIGPLDRESGREAITGSLACGKTWRTRHKKPAGWADESSHGNRDRPYHWRDGRAP